MGAKPVADLANELAEIKRTIEALIDTLNAHAISLAILKDLHNVSEEDLVERRDLLQ